VDCVEAKSAMLASSWFAVTRKMQVSTETSTSGKKITQNSVTVISVDYFTHEKCFKNHFIDTFTFHFFHSFRHLAHRFWL